VSQGLRVPLGVQCVGLDGELLGRGKLGAEDVVLADPYPQVCPRPVGNESCKMY
jgi:hypothetical protein